MKLHRIITAILTTVLLVVMGACEDDVNKTKISTDIVAPSLSALSKSDYALSFDTRDKAFDAFEWSAADFGFEASISYTLQMDTVDGGFENPVALVTTQTLKASPTINDINSALLGMGLPPDVATKVLFRVSASVSENVDAAVSNELSVNVTPYLATFPPIYLIGGVQNWDLAQALEVTSTGPGTYEAIALFQNGKKFRFFETASWDAKQWGFGYFETVPSDLASGEDPDDNFLYNGTDGVFKMTINLNSKTITMEAGELPTLFVIGDGQSWDLQQAAELTFLGGGKFEGQAVLSNSGNFRFFEKADWNATQYGFSYFTDVPAEFTQGDNDDNFLFTGATATYDITVSLNDKTITYEVVSQYPSALYMVGDDQQWVFDNSPAFTAISDGVFEATSVKCSQNATFRFFKESGNWTDAYGYSFFSQGTVDANLGDNGDSDSNFKFLADTGYYNITVSFVDTSITITPGSAYPSALYLVGDDQSWDFANSPTFVDLGNGKFKANGVNFTQDKIFRFFGEKDNWDSDYGYSYFADGGTIDADLGDNADNDSNFKFLAATGTYTITVDFSTKTITVEAGSGYPANLYLVGDDQSWLFANSPTFTTSGDGVYTATGVTFSNSKTFRFFQEVDNWTDDFSAGYFTGTVSNLLQAAGDNDDNFKFVGTDGTYTVTVDLANKSVDLTQ